MNDKILKSVSFFPWMKIHSAATIGNCYLVPFKRGQQPFGKGASDQEAIDGILSFYKEAGRQPITDATLLKLNELDWFEDQTDDQSNQLFAFAEALSFSTLATREYFTYGGGQPNRDCSRLFFQRFVDPNQPPSVTTRRRDGETTIGFSCETFEEIRPRHVSSDFVKIDSQLIGATLDFFATDNGWLLDAAIFSFNNANTDAFHITTAAELVMTVGAFEMLFDVHNGNTDELIRQFDMIFQPAVRVPANGVPRLKTQGDIPNGTLSQIWLKDMALTRHLYAHGKKSTKRYHRKWSTREHLLLSSFLFPYLVKLILQRDTNYVLSEDDHSAIDAFEHLLAEDLFSCSGGGHSALDWPWNQVMHKVTEERRFRKALEVLQKIPESGD